MSDERYELIVRPLEGRPGYVRIGAYYIDDGVIGVVRLGDFPVAWTRIDGHGVSDRELALQILGWR